VAKLIENMHNMSDQTVTQEITKQKKMSQIKLNGMKVWGEQTKSKLSFLNHQSTWFLIVDLSQREDFIGVEKNLAVETATTHEYFPIEPKENRKPKLLRNNIFNEFLFVLFQQTNSQMKKG